MREKRITIESLFFAAILHRRQWYVILSPSLPVLRRFSYVNRVCVPVFLFLFFSDTKKENGGGQPLLVRVGGDVFDPYITAKTDKGSVPLYIHIPRTYCSI